MADWDCGGAKLYCQGNVFSGHLREEKIKGEGLVDEEKGRGEGDRCTFSQGEGSGGLTQEEKRLKGLKVEKWKSVDFFKASL